MKVTEEVVRQHWKQILQIFQKAFIDQDDINCVVSHFQHAVTLLTDEVSNQDCPGPVLLYFISESILDTFFIWSLSCPEYATELKYHQLRCFEFLLSRSQHELLFHKQIFKPLLNLLRSCESSTSLKTIEKHMIVVLNQVCVNITKNPDLLEFCFDISAEHGPSRFIIFSLLIPFVHRDELVDLHFTKESYCLDKPSAQGITTGQQARDALLLIMQLSNRNEFIAKHIVSNTNFCPILATGLSALYSELPHRLTTNNDDWFILTKKEWSQNASLVQFMNSLQFCNDVIQIAHPTIGHHLLQYIYHGFLIPVLGPSIHQDLHEMPVNMSDFQQFSNTMDEVIAATAYLDLFLRSINESSLLKVFLKFILCAKIDEISLLDTLINRINFTTKLGLVSLGLFHTLVNLNCEDIMYRLIFMYLIPCRHVMWSQRRHIPNLEIYGKNAEKFLSLTPIFENRKVHQSESNENTQSKQGQGKLDQNDESKERYETSFAAYLEDAHFNILRCRISCRCWSAPYDGETPSPDAILQETDLISLTSSISSINIDNNKLKTNDYVSNSIANKTQSVNLEKNVAISNDSGINEDVLDPNYHRESISKSINHSFQLPSWLENNQPIPDEILAKHTMCHSSINNYKLNDYYDNEFEDPHPSTFYSFSFIDFSCDNEDTFSIKSSNIPNIAINDEIKSCVETINNCLNKFRQMNEQATNNDCEIINNDISNLLNDLIEQIEYQQTPNEESFNIKLDLNLLNELFTRKLTFNEYLTLLDRLVDNKYLCKNSQKIEDLFNETLSLADDIEQYRIKMLTDKINDNDIESRSYLQDLSNTPSNYFLNKYLQQSTSMDLSLFVTNDLSSQIQSTIFLTNSQQQTSIIDGKPADIGPFLRTIFSKLENMLQNSLNVNLLLTGIISRLAQYSQPLLRSLLLNHSLVLETNIKSLYQILSNIKSKLETISQTFNDFNYLIHLANETLYQRENNSKDIFQDIDKQIRSMSNIKSKSSKEIQENIDDDEQEERVIFEIRHSPIRKEIVSKRNRFFDFFRDQSRVLTRFTFNNNSTNKSNNSQITFIDKTSMKFINIRDNHQTSSFNEWDDPKTRNIAFCSVIFKEFLKELAAIALEHSVQQFDDDQIVDDLSSMKFLF